MSSAKKINYEISLPDLELNQLIGEGNFSWVYKGYIVGSKKQVAIKVSKSGEAHRDLFSMEARFLASIQSPYVVDILHYGESGGHIYLVLELLDGETLQSWLKTNQPTLEQSLHIIGQVAYGLKSVHEQGLIHRDLKPANIWIDNNFNVKIIDLGLADNKKQSIENDGRDVIGSFLYASPEQLGATLQPTDWRSDLYSLGVIFYELCTGELPCKDSNFSNLINWHTAGEYADYEALSAKIPQRIVSVVQTLLKKDPDDRLKSVDQFLKFVNPENPAQLSSNLISREVEVEAISIMIKNLIEQNKGGCQLIKGSPGAGKSYLINHCLNQFVNDDLLILRVKCEEGKIQPFSAMREWSEALANNPKVCNDIEKRVEKISYLDISRISLLRQVFPHFQRIFKHENSQWKGESSGLRETYEAYAGVLKFLSEDFKIIICIDDVQWIDNESLGFLKSISIYSSKLPILLLLTSRAENEYQDTLSYFDESANKGHAKHILLEGLSHKSISLFVSSLLGGRKVDPQIYDLVSERTDGNPFAIKEYVSFLQDQSAIKYQWGQWEFSKEKRDIENIPSSIADILVNKIKNLSFLTKRFLSVAATGGLSFNIDLISRVIDVNDKQLMSIINEAREARLVVKIERNSYKFIHDRVVEALSSFILANEKKHIHFLIAKEEIWRSKSNNNLLNSSTIYSIANNLIKAEVLADPLDVIEWCSLAAFEAMKSHANKESVKYFQLVFEAAEKSKYTLDCKTYGSAGEVYLRLGDHNTAIEYLYCAIQRSENIDDRVSYRLKLIKSYIGTFDLNNQSLIDQFHTIFLELGSWDVKFIGFACANLIISAFGNLIGTWYWLPTKKTSVKRLAEAHFLYALFKYHQGNFFLAIIYSWLSYFKSNRYGDSFELAKASNHAAIAFASMGWRFAASYMQKKGVRIAQNLVDRRLLAECEFYEAFIEEGLGRPQVAAEKLAQVLKKKSHYFHPIDFLNSRFSYIWNMGGRGHIRTMKKEYEVVKKYIENQKGLSPHAYVIFDSTEVAVDNLSGVYQSHKVFDVNSDRTQRLIKENKYVAGVAIQNSILQRVVQEKLDEKELDNLVSLYDSHCGVPPLFTMMVPLAYYYIWKAFGYAQLYMKDPSASLERKLKKSLRHLFVSGLQHTTYRAYYYLLTAIYSYKKDDFKRALYYLNKAEHLSKVHHIPWVELETHYYKHKIYSSLKNVDEMNFEVRAAFDIAKKYGLEFRLRSLKVDLNVAENRHESLATSSSAYMVHSGGKSSAVDKSWSLHGKKRFEALKQLSIELTPTLDSKRQQEIALRNIMETLGAERGFLYSVAEGSELRTPHLLLGLDRSGKLFEDDTSVSQSIVQRVLDTGEPLVFTGSRNEEISAIQSVILKDIRSVIASPLVMGDKLIGIIYLDNRLIRGAFNAHDIDLLMAMSNIVAFSLEMSTKAKIEIAKEELEKDLEVSGVVQRLLIPEKRSWRGTNVNYSFHFEPAEKVGGDWIWMDSDFDQDMYIVLGDVTGHGIGSAMITSLMAGVFKCSWNNHHNLGETFRSMHQCLLETCKSQYGMSCTGVQLSTRTDVMTLLALASPPVFILRDKACLSVGAAGSLLGHGDYQAGIIQENLKPGDRIVIFTDGLYEVRDAQNREYGLGRLTRFLLKRVDLNPQDLKVAMVEEIKSWNDGESLADDLTFVIVDYKS